MEIWLLVNMTKTYAIYAMQSLLFQVRDSGNITDGECVCMMYLFLIQGHLSSNEKTFSQKHNLIFPVTMNHALVLKIYQFALNYQHSYLKCPYYGFLKITFHAVCNSALSKWKHPSNCSIWKCTVYKVIASQKKESTLNHWNESILKRIPSRFMLTSTWNISILPVHLLVF